jgi:hypothetical protein
MKEFLEFLVKGIVSKPEEVEVSEVQSEGVFIYNIHVSDEDMGVVIGKDGKTIRSIRNMAKAKAIKDNVRIQIILEEALQDSTEPSQE